MMMPALATQKCFFHEENSGEAITESFLLPPGVRRHRPKAPESPVSRLARQSVSMASSQSAVFTSIFGQFSRNGNAIRDAA